MHTSKSSQIEAFGHDPSTSTLRVKFRSGQTYEYGEVSEEKFAEMKASESHGKFLASRIKPYHTATKVEPAAPEIPQEPA